MSKSRKLFSVIAASAIVCIVAVAIAIGMFSTSSNAPTNDPDAALSFDTPAELASSAIPAGATEGSLTNIDYVFLEWNKLGANEDQHIAVGFDDESFEPTSATLTVRNAVTSAPVTSVIAEVTPGAVAFNIPASELKPGAFEVASIEYSNDTESTFVDFTADKESEYIFTVSDEALPTDSDASAGKGADEGAAAGAGAVSAGKGEGASAGAASVANFAASAAATSVYALNGNGELVVQSTSQSTSQNGGLGGSGGSGGSGESGGSAGSAGSAGSGGVDALVADIAAAASAASAATSANTATSANASPAASASSSDASRDLAAKSSFTIVIDPGHGGSDVGAIGVGNLYEKDVNLKIAQYCRDKLSSYDNVAIYMTRDSDVYVSLEARAELAHQVGANLFVSIHNNSVANASARGSEVIVPLNGSGTALGERILKNLVALGLTERRVYTRESESRPGQDYYSVIRNTAAYNIPGIIVEHAFVTNEGDAALLRDDSMLRAMGEADAQAIVDQYGLEEAGDDGIYWGIYDYAYYKAANPDLAATLGNRRSAYLEHFLTKGLYEHRRANTVFDIGYYMEKHPDIAAANNNDEYMCAIYFQNSGMRNGYSASPDFDIAAYYNANPDARAAYGSDLQSYFWHYVAWGEDAGRQATNCPQLLGGQSELNGYDYSAVYDTAYYMNNYPELKAAYTSTIGEVTIVDEMGLLRHFTSTGVKEARQGNAEFNVFSYYNGYQDLRYTFRQDPSPYYWHYCESGRAEGRAANPGNGGSPATVGAIWAFETYYGGRDYAPVYDGQAYYDNNSDIRSSFVCKFGTGQVFDDWSLLKHFAVFGMNEGRNAGDKFDVESYYSAHPELHDQLGDNMRAYYLHYLDSLSGSGSGDSGSGDSGNVVVSEASIMGTSQTSVAQMVRRYNAQIVANSSRGWSYPTSVYTQYGAPDISTFCSIIADEATYEGVRPEVLFAQVMHETGWLQFGGDVRPEQCNFGGIGATGGGVGGAWFNDWGTDSVRKGLRAQVQHLKAYATTSPLNRPGDPVDPRYQYVKKGCAPTVYDLAGRWATDPEYGNKLMREINALLSA